MGAGINTYTGESTLSKHRAALYDMAFGASLEEVAESLGMPLQAAATVVESPHWKAELEKIRKAIDERIQERVEGTAVEKTLAVTEIEAAESIRELVNTGPASVRLTASKDVLDRRGYGKVNKQEIDVHQTLHLPEREAVLLAGTLRQVAEMKGLPEGIVEAEIVVIGEEEGEKDSG